MSKTASGQRLAQPCQRTDSEVQVQLAVVCTAEACRGETRWMGLLGGRTMMMYGHACVVGLGDRSRWRGMTASSQQVTDKTGAGLETGERVVVHVAASWKVGSAALLFGISRTAWFRRGCLVGWMRRDYGICFHSRFHGFIYIRQYLHIFLPEHFHFHSLTDSSQGKRAMMPGFGRLQQTDEPAAFHLLQLID